MAEQQQCTNWIKKHSASRNRSYYFNKSTGQSQWTPPDGWSTAPAAASPPPPPSPKTPAAPKSKSTPSNRPPTSSASAVTKLSAKSHDIKRKTPAQDRLRKLQQQIAVERVANAMTNKATNGLQQQVKITKPCKPSLSTATVATTPKKSPPKKASSSTKQIAAIQNVSNPPPKQPLPPKVPEKKLPASETSVVADRPKKRSATNEPLEAPEKKRVPIVTKSVPTKDKSFETKKVTTATAPPSMSSSAKPTERLLSYEEATNAPETPSPIHSILSALSGVKQWVQQRFPGNGDSTTIAATKPIPLPSDKVSRFSTESAAATPIAPPTAVDRLRLSATLGSGGCTTAAGPVAATITSANQFNDDDDVQMTEDDDMTSDSNGKHQ